MAHDEASLVSGVVLAAPFYTGLTLSMQRLLEDGLEGWQALQQRVRADGWTLAQSRTRESPLVFDVDTYRGTGVPRYLASFSVGRDDESIADLQSGLEEKAAPLTLQTLEIRYHDFGVSCLIIHLQTPSGPDIDVESGLHRIEAISSAIGSHEVLWQWCASKTHALESQIPHGFHAHKMAGPTPGVWNEERPGQLLWVHRLLLLRPGVDSSPERAGTCDQGPADPARELRARGLFPGVGTSAVHSGANRTTETDAMVDIITLLTAYWAGSRRLGRTILRHTNRLAVLRRSSNLKGVRQEAYQVVEIHDEIAIFRSILHEHEINFAPLEFDLWAQFSDMWRLRDLLRQLDIRKEDLALLGDRFLSRVQEDNASHLNVAVLALTIIQGIGVLAALLAFSQRPDLQSPSTSKVLIILIAGGTLALLILLITSSDRLRLRSGRGVRLWSAARTRRLASPRRRDGTPEQQSAKSSGAVLRKPGAGSTPPTSPGQTTDDHRGWRAVRTGRPGRRVG